LSRIIKSESAGKERTQLTRGVVVALRELMKQKELNQETLDLLAFITLALESISATLDASVEAWEKRGYWLKADRFRRDWAWAGRLSARLRQALAAEDWPTASQVAAELLGQLNHIEVPQNHRLGKPWVGAWEKLRADAQPGVLQRSAERREASNGRGGSPAPKISPRNL